MAVQASAQNVDWPSYGGDNGSTKYSALNQINSENVSQLLTVWEWASPDNALVPNIIQTEGPMLRPGSFKSTPIVVDGIMYLPTTYGQIVSLDPSSGAVSYTHLTLPTTPYV